MGGSKAPKPDPKIGIAADKSAQVGADALAFMKDQAKITNRWAQQDRRRYKTTFQPLQDQFIKEANDFATPERVQMAADTARADVASAAASAAGTRTRQAIAMGVDPSSGRFQNASAKASTDTALASAGAGNIARRQVEDQGRSLKANAVNLGMGLGVNPATSMGLSNGAVSSGSNSAMNGYGQQGNLLNADYSNRLSAYQAKSSGLSALGSAAGTIAGAMPESAWTSLFAMSSKDFKTNKEPYDGALGVLNSMPVEKWDYKPGIADGGTHIGPYAEDFQAATGMGDGKTIDMISAMGLTMAAVQEMSHEVDEIKTAIGKLTPMGVLEEDGTPEKVEDAQEGNGDGADPETAKDAVAKPSNKVTARGMAMPMGVLPAKKKAAQAPMARAA